MEITCRFPGCDRPVQAKFLCMGHYQQSRRGRVLSQLRPYRYSDLRIIRSVRWEPPQLKAKHKCIDWMLTRTPDAVEGPRIALSLATKEDDQERWSTHHHWRAEYLGYAPCEEIGATASLLIEAIQAEFGEADVTFENDIDYSKEGRHT